MASVEFDWEPPTAFATSPAKVAPPGRRIFSRVVVLSLLVHALVSLCWTYLYVAPEPVASPQSRTQVVYLSVALPSQSKTLDKMETPAIVVEPKEPAPLPAIPEPLKISPPIPPPLPLDKQRHDPRHDPDGSQTLQGVPRRASPKSESKPIPKPKLEPKPGPTPGTTPGTTPGPTQAAKPELKQTDVPVTDRPAEAAPRAPEMNAKDQAWLEGSGMTALADADLGGVDAHSADYYENASRQRFINYYLAAMERQIMEFWPDRHWPKGLTGMIRFELDPFGVLQGAEIHLPSADPAFDQAMLRAVQSVKRYTVPDDPELAARYYSQLRFEYDSNDHSTEKAPWETGATQRLHRAQ